MTATPLTAPASSPAARQMPAAPASRAQQAGTRLAALRDLIRADPYRGFHELRDATAIDPITAQILLAEIFQLLGRCDLALAAAEKAVAVVSRTDIGRLVPARAVLAGIACRLGDRRAVTPCHDYALLAARHSDTPRVLLAGALYAVAVYNAVDCEQGRNRLRRLHHLAQHDDHREHPVAAAISQTATVMRQLCRQPRRLEPASMAVVMPGGLLEDDVSQLAPQALSSLLRGTASGHRCPARCRR